ncbi:Hachiman antiphage defense system protein HamA [Streptomyces sp. NPDC088560]|uniref:Hachiman antiphage defense system protein HamA n=1 Tax=Streptomyces sp. NPDC088560 TaxID=3365868 RepID=UPI00380B230B
MQNLLFEVVSDVTVDNHRYVHVTPKDPVTFAASIAPLITDRYFDEAASQAALLRSASELGLFSGDSFVLSDEDIAAAITEERDAMLPESWKGGRPKHLDVQRSEFGEIVAAEVLKQIFDTQIPASRIKHKEIPDQQTRGADVMGLEDLEQPKPTLIIGEVKGSQDSKSPPGVVAGMVEKLGSLVTDRRALLQELCWLRDHAEDEYVDACSRMYASFVLKREQFEMILTPLLVRTADTHKETDPGEFKNNPDDFGKPVRWVSIVVEGDLFDLAQEVYRIAREGAA